MYFKEIIGHDALKSRLQGALRTRQLAHGLIFEGISGVGKSMTAQAIAAALLCENQMDEACGICPACLKMASDNHPDYSVIIPDGASIKNKQIEEFQEFILLKPYTGDRKIAVIKQAHTMTLSAQNRILKILEEPPSYAVIIFVTDQLEGLLPTIRSRCQIVSFQRLNRSAVEAYLTDRHGIEPRKAQMYASFADGSIQRAEQSVSSEDFVQMRERVIAFTEALIMKKRAKAFDWAADSESQKEEIELTLELLKLWFRDIMLLKNGVDQSLLFNADELDMLKKESYRISLSQSVEILERIEEARTHLASHVNAGLLLETLIMDIQEGM